MIITILLLSLGHIFNMDQFDDHLPRGEKALVAYFIHLYVPISSGTLFSDAVLRNIKLRAAFITSAIIMLVSSCLLLVGS
jgi:hypothetical protein